MNADLQDYWKNGWEKYYPDPDKDGDDIVIHFDFQSSQGFSRKFYGTFQGIDQVPLFEAKDGYKIIQSLKAYVYEKGEHEYVLLSANLEEKLIQVRWFERRQDEIVISHELTGAMEAQAEGARFENMRELLLMTELLAKIDSTRNVIPQSVLEALDSLGY